MKKWVVISSLYCLIGASFSMAAVPVEDIQDRTPLTTSPMRPTAEALSPIAAPPLAEPVDSYTKLQLLQEEVMQLRGLVEELAYEVKLLKQRQMDDYMDLDRRLSVGIPADSIAATSPPVVSPITAAPLANGADNAEVQSYSNAYNLLKASQVNESVAAFKQHIEDYPTGTYTPNCHYWLGEIYVLQNQLEDARQSFTMVAENYPAHRKASDATFKLGKVYHLLGDMKKAKIHLQKVAAGSSTTAKLAQKYLDENF